MSTPETHILKFGGSSLATSSLIRQSSQVVMERMQTARPVIVVSAIGGVTDTLIELARKNPVEDDVATSIRQLKNKHLALFDKLVASRPDERSTLEKLFNKLQTTVNDRELRSKNPRAWTDNILSFGERASALIFAALLSEEGLPASPFEAHQFIKTDSTFGQARVNTELTRKLVRNYIGNAQSIPVITGFIGSNNKQQITTLGRSGSDYTAGLIANALEADHLEIWTDVNGVLTADPKWVPTAESIQQLSFGDIAELSAHGAKVIHPQTIRPIQHQNTSVLVKNTYDPLHPGTLITSDYNSNGALKTITVTGPFVRLQVDEQHTYDLLSKLREWNHRRRNSEAIGFRHTSNFEPTQFILRKSFFEKKSDRLANWANANNVVLDLETDLYKVKKFSNQFENNEDLTNRVWNLLASNDLQPVASERNRSERFISFLFEKGDAQRAARLLNDYLQGDHIVVDLFIAGTGAVGQTLLEKLKKNEPDNMHFRLLGACNSRKALWNDRGLDLRTELNWSEAQPTEWNFLTDQLNKPHRHNLIFVDATGSEQVARLYPELLKNGTHIVTPSKLANTFEQAFFDELQSLVNKNKTSFRYETTVGAGLPVISTLEDVTSGGDKITEISGVLSGTMTYLFNQLEKGVPFSKAVIDARRKGYAEPDPRDDLSGEDVARKFLTMARTLGLKIERNELNVESLIPEELINVDQATFLNRLSDYDKQWMHRIKEVQKNDKTLRYTGKLVDGVISIGIESVPKDSPLGQLKGTDNLVQIFSDFYNQTPLVIQGAGAGRQVTAAGVLTDILKTAHTFS